MSVEKCDTCRGYHAPGVPCSPVDALQPWGADPSRERMVDITRRPGRCDTCGDPTTGFTNDGTVRCPECQRRRRT